MAHFQTEENTRFRRHMVEQAIALAMQNRWQEAVAVNRAILERFPNDVEAWNRLGRALLELGRYAEARDAYRRAVELDPNNVIAQRNLSRLSALAVEAATPPASEKVDPHLFITETGKSAIVPLVRVASPEVLAKMTVGDQVYLEIQGRSLAVRNARGEVLGYVEPKTAQRLIDLMRTGNRYAAALVSLDDGVKIIIREVYQDPRNAGRISFPPRGGEPGVRPYTREALLKYEEEEEEEEEEELAEELEFGGEPELETEEMSEVSEFEEEEEETE